MQWMQHSTTCGFALDLCSPASCIMVSIKAIVLGACALSVEAFVPAGPSAAVRLPFTRNTGAIIGCFGVWPSARSS